MIARTKIEIPIEGVSTWKLEICIGLAKKEGKELTEWLLDRMYEYTENEKAEEQKRAAFKLEIVKQ